MMIPNHGIHPEWYPYITFKEKIKNFFIKERKKIKKLSIDGFDFKKPEEIFWNIVEGKNFQKDDVYYRILCYYVQYINFLILKDMGKIKKKTYQFWNDWMKYLHSNVFVPGYFMSYTDKTIEILCKQIPHSEEIISIYKILFYNKFEKNEIKIKKLLIPFWKEFSYNFLLNYKLFKEKSMLIGKELADQRNIIKYSNLVDIYQLKLDPKESNENTPIIDLNNKIYELVHIRNAISHSLFSFNELEDSITIWDKNRRGKETFRKIYTKQELLKAKYRLFLLGIGLEKVAIYYSVIQRLFMIILDKDNEMKTPIICPICNWITFRFLLPKQDKIKCDYCKTEIDISTMEKFSLSKNKKGE